MRNKHNGGTMPVTGATSVRVWNTLGECESGRADAFTWEWSRIDGEGRIVEYEVVGIGDVNSAEPGTGARYNAGKPPVELIPANIIGDYWAWRARAGEVAIGYAAAMTALGDFQMRQGDPRERLFIVIAALGQPWTMCADVFGYGRAKYAAWNWSKGMPWSVPIGCAMRHILAAHAGEPRDSESNLFHAGHAMCNIVMLLHYLDHYEAGDDRAPALS